MFETIGVVPIFVNAGAAVLPALLAALASLLALLLKPRELWAALRRRPAVPAGLAAAALAGWGLWAALARPAPAAARAPARPAATDWVKVALDRLREEARGAAAAAPAAVAPAPAGALYFRGGAARTGHLGGPPPTGLAPLWEYAEENAMFLSSPLVAGDAVYGASCTLDVGGNYGSVFCLDAATGRARWTAEYKDAGRTRDFQGFFSSPALSADGATLVIGQGLHADYGSDLVGLDAKSGRVRWLVPTPLHIEGSPAIEGDVAVAGAGAVEQGPEHRPRGDPEREGHPGFVLGVRVSDGSVLWRYPLADPESSPAIADGIAYIGSGLNGCAVAALRIAPDDELKERGLERLVWRMPTDYPATGAVTVHGDLVLVGCGKGDFVFAAPDPEGLVLALDRATGAERWRARMPDAVLGAIAARDGRAACPVRNGEVVMIDLAAGGRVLWRARVHGESPVLAAPAFAGSHVYAVSQDGYLAVFDAATGAALERVYLNAPGKPGEMGLSVSSPLVAGGRLYVGSETGGLRAFEPKAGAGTATAEAAP